MKNYKELKKKNLAVIIKTENSCAISYAQFDTATGERLPDLVLLLDVAGLQSQVVELEVKLAEVKELLVEIEATQVSP